MMHWIDNADSYICPVCGFETDNPLRFKCKCPVCEFMDKKDREAMMDKEKTASLDYEAGYNKLREENAQLRMKLTDVDYRNSALEAEIAKFRAQMDVVYLIFGKR